MFHAPEIGQVLRVPHRAIFGWASRLKRLPPPSPSAGRPGCTTPTRVRLLDLPCLARAPLGTGIGTGTGTGTGSIPWTPSHYPPSGKDHLLPLPKPPEPVTHSLPLSILSTNRCPPLPASILPFFYNISRAPLPQSVRDPVTSLSTSIPSASAFPASIDVAVVPASSLAHHSFSLSLPSTTMNHVAMAPTDEQLDRDWQPNGRRPQS